MNKNPNRTWKYGKFLYTSLQVLTPVALLLTGLILFTATANADEVLPGSTLAQTLNITGTSISCIEAEHPDYVLYTSYWSPIYSSHSPEKVFGKEITILSPPVLKQWQTLSSRMKRYSKVEKLQYINGFFNRWPSATDEVLYGKKEYWASPEEFLDKGGDCEDFAIVKYFALKYFDWPEQYLWIVLVRDKKEDYNHAVLAVHDGQKTFILDNLSRPPYLLIPADKYFQRVTPLFALNASGLWAFTPDDSLMDVEQKENTDKSKTPAKTYPK